MAWDHRYRRLEEGEVIRQTDECLTDSHLGWVQDKGQCAGKKAPSPLFTSHRIYRRKSNCPLCSLVAHMVKVMHAKFVMMRTLKK